MPMNSPLHRKSSAEADSVGSVESVDATNAQQVRHWANQLMCTEKQLRNAINAVGSILRQVRKYLRRHP